MIDSAAVFLLKNQIKITANLQKMQFCGYGGDGGIRTHDLCVANAALSQLSYTPV